MKPNSAFENGRERVKKLLLASLRTRGTRTAKSVISYHRKKKNQVNFQWSNNHFQKKEHTQHTGPHRINYVYSTNISEPLLHGLPSVGSEQNNAMIHTGKN